MPRERSRLDTLRTHLLEILAVAGYLLGVALRAIYVLRDHPPRHEVFSDAIDVLRFAVHFGDPAVLQDQVNTIWPPGSSAIMSALLAADPTAGLAGWAQLLIGCAIPLFVARTAWLLFGRRAACLALIFASLGFGYIHYAGFFLSELFFQGAMTLALWATVLTLVRIDAAPAPPGPRGVLVGALRGLPMGLAWALAALFRPNAIPTGLFIVACLAGYSLARRRPARIPALLAAALAGAVVLAPMADRCTGLNHDSFCVVSSNAAMNVAMGQAGPVRTVEFVDQETGKADGWSPPSLGQLDYRGSAQVPASIFDGDRILAWVMDRFFEDPGRFLARALGNGLDLFRFEYWPKRNGQWDDRLVTVMGQLFWLVVLGPSLLGFFACAVAVARRRASSAEAFVVFAVVAVFLVACLSMGESRYRSAFDALWIALSAAVWSGRRGVLAGRDQPAEDPGPPDAPRARGGLPLVLAGAAAAVVIAFVTAVSHPSLALARHFGSGPVPEGVSVLRHDAAELAPKKNRAKVDKDTLAIDCREGCPELLLTWPEPQSAGRLELSLDRSDCYLVRAYLDGVTVQSWTLLPSGYRPELRVRREDVSGPFDAVGVLPLWGDGEYAVGHARPRPR